MKLLAVADARRIPLADESVHCVVTSPPFWGLRDYGVDGQLGLEPTPEEYVANMVEVFREVRRVLREDGTLWLNLGDSYATKPGNNDYHGKGPDTSGLTNPERQRAARNTSTLNVPVPAGLKPKDLVGVPWRVAFALQADGWYLRSDIIWSKPNPMPESVTDRPTKAHEYLFLLSRSRDYFYDGEAIREPATARPQNRYADPATHRYHAEGLGPTLPRHKGLHKPERLPALEGAHGTTGHDGHGMRMPEKWNNPAGRNRRTVWTVATAPYSGSHFATFPPKLIEPCILAGTSARGCCPECGAGWTRAVERSPMEIARSERTHDRGRTRSSGTMTKPPENTTTGWRPACDHDHQPAPCTVLDPFCGSGTTVAVAVQHGRHGIGLDLSAKYLHDLARTRTGHVQMELPA